MQKTIKHLKLTFTSLSLLVLLLISLVLFVAQVARAQGDATTSPRTVKLETRVAEKAERKADMDAQMEDRKAAMEAKRLELEKRKEDRVKFIEERKTQIDEKRAALKTQKDARVATLAENAQKRIADRSAKLMDRLTRAIDMIGATVDRLRTRANELAGRGVDTDAFIAALDEVDETLAEASAALAGIDVEVEYATTSEKPKNNWAPVRAQFTVVRDLIKKAHTDLRAALAAFKVEVKKTTDTGASAAVRADASMDTATGTTSE